MKVELTKQAKKDVRLFSPEERKRIGAALDKLQADPYSCDFKKLKGQEDLWRLRIGDLRVIIQPDKQAQIHYILTIKPRKNAYR